MSMRYNLIISEEVRPILAYSIANNITLTVEIRRKRGRAKRGRPIDGVQQNYIAVPVQKLTNKNTHNQKNDRRDRADTGQLARQATGAGGDRDVLHAAGR